MEDLSGTKLGYLREMRYLAEDLWHMTSMVILTGETGAADTEAEDYSRLMERRAPMIEEMTALKRKADTADAGALAERCAKEKQVVDQILKNIMELDKEHEQAAKRIKASLQSSIRNVKSGQKLSSAYTVFGDGPRSSRLDTKQ